MAWSPTEDGIGKSRLKVVQNLLQSKMTDLSDALASDSTLSYLITNYAALDSSMVKRGDFTAGWLSKTGPLRIFVSGSGHQEGIDLTQSPLFITQEIPGGKLRKYQTSVFVYFHPDVFNIEQNPDLQAQIREDAFQTVQDWIDFDVFGTASARILPLSSHCYNTSPGNDRLIDVRIQQAMKIMVERGPGDVELYTGLWLLLMATVA